ncbi:MAG: hypothetical protein ACREUQ_06020 [Burkholderiales bacterium]
MIIFSAPIEAADESSTWAAGLKNLTPEEGLTLLKLTRDFFPHDELADARYTRCIDPYDTAAADGKAKQEIDEALDMVSGATRRMGYKTYPGISDDYERVRLSKMLADGRWMRKFKKAVEQCLYAQPEVKAKLKRD